MGMMFLSWILGGEMFESAVIHHLGFESLHPLRYRRISQQVGPELQMQVQAELADTSLMFQSHSKSEDTWYLSWDSSFAASAPFGSVYFPSNSDSYSPLCGGKFRKAGEQKPPSPWKLQVHGVLRKLWVQHAQWLENLPELLIRMHESNKIIVRLSQKGNLLFGNLSVFWLVWTYLG